MTKEVLISISGIQTADGEDNDVEMITPGSYYQKEGKHYILYDEAVEGMKDVIKNTIKITPSSLEIRKRGLTNVHMVFEAGKKTSSTYVTPFGEMIVSLDTSRIKVEEEENNIRAYVEYNLDINYDPLSACRITVDVRPRGKAELHLV